MRGKYLILIVLFSIIMVSCRSDGMSVQEKKACTIQFDVGDIVNATVVGTGDLGDGIIKLGGFVIFTDAYVENKSYEFEITKIERKYGEAKKLREINGTVLSKFDVLENSSCITPIKINQKFNVTIETKGSEGDGIAKIDGFIVFVPNGEIGKNYAVKIIDVEKDMVQLK